jgi:hypothetical protein
VCRQGGEKHGANEYEGQVAGESVRFSPMLTPSATKRKWQGNQFVCGSLLFFFIVRPQRIGSKQGFLFNHLFRGLSRSIRE